MYKNVHSETSLSEVPLKLLSLNWSEVLGLFELILRRHHKGFMSIFCYLLVSFGWSFSVVLSKILCRRRDNLLFGLNLVNIRISGWVFDNYRFNIYAKNIFGNGTDEMEFLEIRLLPMSK